MTLDIGITKKAHGKNMTIDPARALAQNIRAGSGNHGMTEDELYDVFKNCSQPERLAFSLFKCAEVSGKSAFTTQLKTLTKPSLNSFTVWHQIDEQWNSTWGFEKTHPGCYVYGLYSEVPEGPADFLDEGIIYIGESRATSRNSMLGRRTDFKGTVRNQRLSPYGCGTAFKEAFGADKIDQVYQAYLPMHPSYCKDVELELLAKYYEKYNRIPLCNPKLDLVRVLKFLNKE
jgi:hypothetical protein